MRQDTRLITSAVAFALACLVMVTLHEAAHAVAGLLQGGRPTMYAYAVDNSGLDDGQQIVTALAGPVFSLVSGLVVLALPRTSLPAFWRLAVLWLGLLSVQELSGHLITGAFTAGGAGAGIVLFEAFGVLAAGIFLVFVRVFLPVTGRASPADLPSGFPLAGLVVLVVVALVRQLVLAGGLVL